MFRTTMLAIVAVLALQPQDSLASHISEAQAITAFQALQVRVDALEALGPTPLEGCQTISTTGSYVVTQNLTATGDCLIVATDFVTIDLAGFTISGDGTGEGVTTTCCDGRLAGIAVRNGTVTNFFRGIYLELVDGAVVEAVRVIDNLNSGIITDSPCIVRNNLAQGNVFDGIRTGGDCVVTGNTIRGSGNIGLLVLGGIVSGNIASLNGAQGILVFCPANVIGNLAFGNTGDNLAFVGVTCNDQDNVAPAP